MTRGRDSLLTKAATASSVIPSERTAFPSSKSLSSISCLILEEPNNRNRFALGVSLGIIQRGQGLGRGASLLLQPRYNGVGSSSTSILHRLAILEELECWIATNFKLFCGGAFFSSIKLA